MAGKNRSKKTTASRGPTAIPAKRGTGFEEFFADPPMTPEEAREEQEEIYADDLSFESRIQSCIQRYRARRRFQNGTRQRYFNDYLLLGGIDTSPNTFTGNDKRELKDMTPAERREATARDAVYATDAAGDRWYNGDFENWSVDFKGVAAGFLSISLVQMTGWEHDEMDIAIGVVENFLRYVLQHDVCPEHDRDVKGALEVCADARMEWPMVHRLQGLLPGSFNLAASKFFPVAEGVAMLGEKDGETGTDLASYSGLKPRSDKGNPKTLLLTSLALMGNMELVQQLSQPGRQVVAEFECTLQIVKIDLPAEDIINRFKAIRLDDSDPESDSKINLRLQAIGKVILKPATIEDEFDHPFVKTPATGQKKMSLFFDLNILRQMKPGMKMTLVLRQLDNGIRFVKELVSVVPTFYTFLPQELMRYYKPPRENDRPGPSIHTINAENGGEGGQEEQAEEGE